MLPAQQIQAVKGVHSGLMPVPVELDSFRLVFIFTWVIALAC